MEVSYWPDIVEWIFHVFETHDGVWLKELKGQVNCWDDWIRQKITYECETFFFDHVGIEVRVVVSDRVPEYFLGVASGPTESYQPTNSFLM